MSIRVIGMIGVTPPKSAATLHVIEGGLSPNYVAEAASIWCWSVIRPRPPRAFWWRCTRRRAPNGSAT
jgi:hypothetical protein